MSLIKTVELPSFALVWTTLQVPAEMAAHKPANAKVSYRVNSHQSAFILEETKMLIPVGSRELYCFYQLHVA